jgi:hypothetical protein
MKRLALPLLAALALCGCVPMMAANAVGSAVGAASGGPSARAGQDLREPARTACNERAAPLGTVRLIDAVQRPDGRVTVWGTVESAGRRRSFECRYEGRVTGFKLRAIQG